MAFLPAVCDSCGAVFAQNGIEVENSTGISFRDVSVGPCPRCGGMGHIPDGVYNIIGNVIEAFGTTARGRSDIARIAAIFREARETKSSAAEVADKIRRETPSLARIADLLPTNRTDLYGFLSMGIAAASLYAQLSTKDAPALTVNQVINQITIEAPKPRTAQQPRQQERSSAGQNFRKEKRRVKKGDRQVRK